MIKLKKLQQRKFCHGWILYSSKDKGINEHYIDLYRKACERNAMSAELGICDTECIANQDSRRQLEELVIREEPAYVINRTRDYHIAKLLENMGIRVFNNSQIAELGNDKAKAYRYMQERGIPIMPTVYSIKNAPQWYPAVIKSRDGHGGTEVYLIQDESAWEEWKAQQDWNEKRNAQIGNKGYKKEYIMQQEASEPGRDVRVYIVGNKIAAAVLRTSDTDFRSNYCLGGSVRLYTIRDSERSLVERAAAGLTIGMAGIDFIFHNGEMVFNEIEDTAGARGLYALTDYDIADEYVQYIKEELTACRNQNKNSRGSAKNVW